MSSLVDRLTATDPADRPVSADQALADLHDDVARTMPGPATDATEPLPTTEPTAKLGSGLGGVSRVRERYRPLAPGRLLGALAVLAAIILALVVILGSGDNPSPSRTGQLDRATEPPAAAGERSPEPAPAPAAGETEADVAPGVTCSAVEEERRALEEEKKAAEERTEDDKGAKEAIKAQFEAKQKTLEARAKSCEE